MKQYLQDLKNIIEHGQERINRTGTDTVQLFGMQTRYDLQAGFPALTTKRLAWKSVVSELLWFLEGSGDERRLCEILHGSTSAEKKTIWTANAEAGYWKHKAKFTGDLGRVYGVQWRHWQSFDSLTPDHEGGLMSGRITEVDQIANLVRNIKNDPFGRRHLLTAWNPGELDNMALPPCHLLAQFNVTADGNLDCQMYQRSADFPLGVPFNIASYALLTHMLAQVCGLGVGDFVHVVGDAHIYKNQISTAEEQILREPLELPELWLNPDITDIDDFSTADIKLLNYRHHPKLNYPFSV